METFKDKCGVCGNELVESPHILFVKSDGNGVKICDMCNKHIDTFQQNRLSDLNKERLKVSANYLRSYAKTKDKEVVEKLKNIILNKETDIKLDVGMGKTEKAVMPTGNKFMFCIDCGEQLPAESAFCSACGKNLKAITQKVNPNAETEEKIIMQGVCNRVKSAMNVQNGKAMLTNKRFIYLKHSAAKTLVIGMFVNLTSGSYEFDIPLSDITSIEDGRQGISKTIIINTKLGKKYNFYFTKREEWKIAFQNAVKKI